jgi:hypothetical protein
MTTPNLPPLSPAAQAVMDAAYEELDYVPQRHVRWCAAAALRAAALYCKRDSVILLSLADELEQ